jgi:4-amino-4-deoxy-L-arabinose transferase-like glycosyltransferase
MHLLQGYEVGSTSTRRELFLLIGIAVFAFGTRVLVALLTTSWVFPSTKNFWEYGYEMGQIAASIALGNGFSWPEWSAFPAGPTAWMPPVYPYIMAGVFKVFGIYTQQSAIALQLFQTILSTFSCCLLYLLGKHLYDARVGLVAAFLFAIYPPSIHYAVRYVWGTSLFVCLFLLIILIFLQQADRPNPKGAVRFGILLGFTALVDPIIVGIYPFAFAWLYLKAAGDRRTTIKTLLTLSFTCLIVVSPWITRNYFIFGKVIPIKSNSGRELFMGNNKYAVGTYEDSLSTFRKHHDLFDSFTENELEYLEKADEVEKNSFLSRKAIEFIVDHPLSFAHRTITRFFLYWTYTRPVENSQQKISLLTYFVILLLAVIGILMSRVKHIHLRIMPLFLIILPLPYYFTTVGVFRYRYPIEPLLIVLAGYALCTALSPWIRTTLKAS